MADRPVQKCKCGADCDWCIGANRARRAFPNAIEPPQHDHENAVHECVECFERAFERMMREVRGG